MEWAEVSILRIVEVTAACLPFVVSLSNHERTPEAGISPFDRLGANGG